MNTNIKYYKTCIEYTGDTKFFICGMSDFKPHNRVRTYGWFNTWDYAYSVVSNNSCDIYECSNTYVVIEEIKEGPFGLVVKEWWFRWNKKLKKYVSIDKPKKTYGIINWSM